MTEASASCPPRVPLFGIELGAVTLEHAASRVLTLVRDEAAHCRYVVTPNLDHVVLLRNHERLRAAYADATMVVADGWPVVLASRLFGRPLPERVTGVDLVTTVFETASPRLPVFLLRALPGVAERAAREIPRRWPAVEIVGTCSPPPGFEESLEICDAIVDEIRRAEPRILVVGLGCPKQEIWRWAPSSLAWSSPPSPTGRRSPPASPSCATSSSPCSSSRWGSRSPCPRRHSSRWRWGAPPSST